MRKHTSITYIKSDFALRYALIYPSVNSQAELAIIAPKTFFIFSRVVLWEKHALFIRF